MNKIILGMYWGPREESRLSSATRLSTFFKSIRVADPALSTWEMVVDKHVTVNTSADSLVFAFTDSRTEDTPDAPVDLSQGYFFRGWTAKGVGDARLSGCMGSTRQNNILITTREGEFTDEELMRLFTVMVAVFDPDDAILSGGDLLESAYKRLNESRSLGQYSSLSAEPAWCNYKRGTSLSPESFSRR
jgi:hypothetical protein